LKHSFRVFEEEFGVKVHDRGAKIKEWELIWIGSIIEKQLHCDLAAFAKTPCKVGAQWYEVR
jgi:hypothetical protein